MEFMVIQNFIPMQTILQISNDGFLCSFYVYARFYGNDAIFQMRVFHVGRKRGYYGANVWYLHGYC